MSYGALACWHAVPDGLVRQVANFEDRIPGPDTVWDGSLDRGDRRGLRQQRWSPRIAG